MVLHTMEAILKKMFRRLLRHVERFLDRGLPFSGPHEMRHYLEGRTRSRCVGKQHGFDRAREPGHGAERFFDG